ncbi:MAG: NINE protein [Propionibacteriales bacterium]|nr:NINE protein [Propionibacteriales bacterium]
MSQPPNPPYGDPNQPYGGANQPPLPPQGYGQPAYAPAPGGPFFISVLGQEQGPIDYGSLAQMAVSGQLKPDTPVRTHESPNWFSAKDVPGLYSDKEWLTTLLLSIIVGGLGVDRFYLGQTGLGIAKLLTCGGCGVWSIIDIILIAMRKLPDAQGRPLR